MNQKENIDRVRVIKILARAGLCSRRGAERLLREGRVLLNGSSVVDDRTEMVWGRDQLICDGQVVHELEKRRIYLLNKPIGYLCTNAPAAKGTRVIDLFPVEERLFTVGRLDRDSHGLILVTNYGPLFKAIHPSVELEREYLVEVDRPLRSREIITISHGCRIERTWVKPLKIKQLGPRRLSIVLSEGKKHEVRHLVKMAQRKALDLCRIRIGRLTLGGLKSGGYRSLSLPELQKGLGLHL